MKGICGVTQVEAGVTGLALPPPTSETQKRKAGTWGKGSFWGNTGLGYPAPVPSSYFHPHCPSEENAICLWYLHPSFPFGHQFTGAITVEYHRLGGLNSRYLFSRSSGGWRSPRTTLYFVAENVRSLLLTHYLRPAPSQHFANIQHSENHSSFLLPWGKSVRDLFVVCQS